MAVRRILLALPLLFALTGCEFLQPKVSSDTLEAELIKWMATEFGMTATEANCPDNQKLETGNRFECTCKIEGVEVPFLIEVLDPLDQSVKWELKYTIVDDETLEQSIAALPELAGHSITIDCPQQPLYLSIPESKTVCDLNDNGAVFVVNLEFTDDNGAYKIDVAAKT